MKTLAQSTFALFLLFSSTVAHAEKLLDCNIPSGPLQQIQVMREADGLKLKKLTNTGSWRTEELPTESWEAKRLVVFDDNLWGKGVVALTDDEWAYVWQADEQSRYFSIISCR